jgi:hypothetical protein
MEFDLKTQIKTVDVIRYNRKIANYNYSNSELIDILVDRDLTKYIEKIHDCDQQNPKDVQKFLSCMYVGACPREFECLSDCVRAKNDNCLAYSVKITDCLSQNTEKILQIINKTSFKF